MLKIPWQVVVLDDGMSWLGTAHNDPNGKIGRAWDALWSKSDGWAGLAGLPPYFGGRGDLWTSWMTNGSGIISDAYDDEDEEEHEDDGDSDSSDEDGSDDVSMSFVSMITSCVLLFLHCRLNRKYLLCSIVML